MFKYITRRMFWSIVTLFTILILLFLLLQFLPGTPFNDEKLSEASKALLNAKYGLDQPILSRFGIYMKNILTEFDFGISLSIQRNWMVKNIVLPRLGISVRIGLQALALGTFMGIVLGVLSASKKNTWVDTLSTDFECILFEQRGIGLSGNVKLDSTTINLKRAVLDIEDLRKHLGRNQISLCGISWGGGLAQAYSSYYPDNVKNMVLM
ncbi:MAG: alpha/beta fold hydrolase [Erysipelotrichaceae bacterium]|nr:alpha/beta fold hydrolase [Erysipelotrichaceae bacterium]